MKRTRKEHGFCYKERLKKEEKNMTEIISKSYQGTKPDIIAVVTDKPTERSERLWRSKKSPPHPETAAMRD